nr:NADH dehydrogenase subunit 5 [Cavernulicola chilensis]
MYLLTIFLPLISSFISGLGGRFIGSKGATFVTCFCILLTTIISIAVFYEVALSEYICHIVLTNWIESDLFCASWGFLFDSLTVTIIVVVTFVSSLVHLYSSEYIYQDPHRPRFISYLSLFTFFILILVSADNFVQIFFGWEGVGLSSYLLINFWYTRLNANKAAIKAIIVNRIGDLSLSLGIFGIFYIFQSVDYATIFALVPLIASEHFQFLTIDLHGFTLICLLLFVGAIGKSAQIGLHTWLPDAMEGPTPVSALIHAATMVTAGVFLLARCSPIFEFAPTSLVIIMFVGGITTFFAASTAIFQYDLKKVIAYSTCSQLGYIIFACGCSNYAVSIFHLVNHAFFKALLFLGAGSVIHELSDEQDIRRLGGLIKKIPFTYVIMLVGSLSLMGFPFLTGFYSKDLILESAFTIYTIPGSFVYWIGSLSIIFTSFYSIRILFLTFLNKPNIPSIWLRNIHEGAPWLLMPLALLAIGSIVGGYLLHDIIVGTGTDFWGSSLFVIPNNFVESEFTTTTRKWSPFFLSMVGMLLGFLTNVWLIHSAVHFQLSNLGRWFTFLLNKKWYWDQLYNYLVVKQIINFGYLITFKALDRGVIEIFGPYGLTKSLPLGARQITNIQSGQLAHYAFIILVGLTILIILIEFWDVIFLIADSRVLSVLFLSLFFITPVVLK